MSDNLTNAKPKQEDIALDSTLRPKKWDEYIGQEKIKRNLEILIQAAKKRKESVDHILLYGPAGLGKTTLANLIARETNANIRITSGPAIEKVGDLASILTNLQNNDILFIDEAHRLNRTIEEVLYPAMESHKIDIIIGKGPSARTIQLDLPRFTLIAATTRIGLLSSPLRSRFGVTCRLEFYQQEEIEQIIERSARLLNVIPEKGAISTIASSARSTPRIANRLLKRVRDLAQVREMEKINEKVAKETLSMLEIDEQGLEQNDINILKTVIEKFNGGPVGLKTIASATSEEIDTIEDIYEPYLLQIGLLARTPQGRVATKAAYEYLGKKQNQLDF